MEKHQSLAPLLTEARFIEFYQKRTGRNLEEIRTRRAEVAERLGSARGQLESAGGECGNRADRRQMKGRLQELRDRLVSKLKTLLKEEETHSLSVEMLREMYARIVATPRVVRVGLFDNLETIEVTTNTLYGKRNRQWYRFNPVRGSLWLPPSGSDVNTTPPTIKWSCPTGNIKPQGLLAPQVICESYACLGTQALRAFKQDIAEHNYSGMVALIPRFAECFGEKDSSMWPQINTSSVPEWYIQTFGQ
ncbi:MAG: hypothetical protein WA021_00345 [Minisyncoccia bacterium]